MRINIYTNTQKSQFRNVKDGVWQILGIPITVDDAVMKGVLYDKTDNAAGLASYRDKVVVLRHPEDENGNGISASSGKALMNHFSGGAIINTYNHNGVNYADAEFNESQMRAQANGDYYADRLKNGEPIGISTGLYFEGNNESGVNACGDKYHAKAKNQEGDHVAMLPDEEPPAGGAATFIRFNGENDDQTLTVNIDEMLLSINADVQTVIDEVATNEEEKGLIARFVAAWNRTFATDKQLGDNSQDNLITNQEGDAMRETVEKELKAKGIAFNASATDAELLALLNKPVEVADNTAVITAAVNAAIAPLTEKLTAVELELAGNKDADLEKLATQASGAIKGLTVEAAKAMGTNAIHAVLAANGVTVGAPNAENHQSPEDKIEPGINMKPWDDKEAK